MSTTLQHSLRPTLRLFVQIAALALAVAAANPAQAAGSVQVGWRGGQQHQHHQHGHGHGHGHRGWGWGLLPWVLAPLFLQPQVVTVVQTPAPVLVEVPPPVAAAPSRPDPVIYPRNGQNAQLLEADRQECNRWATTQPQALADSSVFMRAADACMDGRGYTTK